ncbi:deoxyribose-phosphate aldolase [Coprobacter tertius]|uniref:Deoxyribose-phosphate aldolase n=1 Tax=Coprobacter tertius TaxID=2944915 RepID=A0ABT1MH63_9BACT|nr:deoxyribose-phosphate aldolase [Coprobacter tertius]MCP9610581.1 deoxyribose-phosphate aldolase [Coprobacter tertius]
MDKYNEALKGYITDLNDETVKQSVEKILRDNLAKNSNTEVYKFLFGCIDLTTLKTTDSNTSVAAFTKRVNDFENEHPDMKNVAAICVYPNFAEIVRMNLEVSSVNIACVSAGFPSSQTFSEIKVAETSMAVADGADEIDIVINVGDFLSGEYEEMCDEIEEIKEACRTAHMKVILETGALKTASNIKKAAILSMYSGADFIKTSTGKLEPAATLEAAYVMCQAIKEYYEKTGRKVGFKPAGGIVTSEDAVKYYCIVSEILGKEWLTRDLFRIGASRLANNLLTSIAGKDIKFF